MSSRVGGNLSKISRNTHIIFNNIIPREMLAFPNEVRLVSEKCR